MRQILAKVELQMAHSDKSILPNKLNEKSGNRYA